MSRLGQELPSFLQQQNCSYGVLPFVETLERYHLRNFISRLQFDNNISVRKLFFKL